MNVLEYYKRGFIFYFHYIKLNMYLHDLSKILCNQINALDLKSDQ